ncbi:MAG: PorT family protein [Clostridium sp.]|nr:PorT family protein [Bacteroides sp.]MCM1197497.1 PorT family protein [Clostridium sp.]
MNNMEQWKNGLRESMEDFSMDSPEGLWDSIESSVPSRKRRPAALWFIPAAAAAAIAIAVVFMHRPSPSGPELIADNIPYLSGTETIDIQEPVHNPETAYSPVTATAALQDTKNRTMTEIAMDPDIVPCDTEAAGKEHDRLTKDDEKPQYGSISTGRGQHDKEELPPLWGTEERNLAEGSRLVEDNDTQRSRRGKFSGSISLGGAPGTMDSHSGYGDAMVARSEMSSFHFGEDPMADIATYNQEKEIGTQVRHFQPVSAGITARYSIGRFGIESGITYSCLMSRIRSGSDSYYYARDQKLHYLGIPVNFSYAIWESSHFGVYVSAGGTMEKCIAGSGRTEYFYNGAKGDTQHEKLSIRPLQWSVQAAGGIQYDITDFVGIYLEPGISFHFRNGSTIESPYTAHPLNFSLGIGLRFNIE